MFIPQKFQFFMENCNYCIYKKIIKIMMQKIKQLDQN